MTQHIAGRCLYFKVIRLSAHISLCRIYHLISSPGSSFFLWMAHFASYQIHDVFIPGKEAAQKAPDRKGYRPDPLSCRQKMKATLNPTKATQYGPIWQVEHYEN